MVSLRSVLLALPVLGAVAGGAYAADLVVEEVPAVPVYDASYDWNGAYIGVVGGYGWGESDFRQSDPSLDIVDIEGYLLGGTLGANHVLGSNFLIGVEGDLAYSTISGEFGPGALPGGFNCTDPCVTDIDWLGTLRARAGFAVDSFLVYATAGLAVAGVHSEIENDADFDVDSTSFGWTAGAGVEVALSEGWSAKLEYLYVDLGETEWADNDFRTNNELNIVRAGLNYKF